MTTSDILDLAAIVTSLFVLRFGVPILFMWAFGKLLHRLQQS